MQDRGSDISQTAGLERRVLQRDAEGDGVRGVCGIDLAGLIEHHVGVTVVSRDQQHDIRVLLDLRDDAARKQEGARLVLLGTDVQVLTEAAEAAAEQAGAEVLHIVAADRKGYAACLADISKKDEAVLAQLEEKVIRARML